MEKIAIISDIHANYHALKSVLSDIDDRKIDKIICLGDIVGYGSMPDECVTELRTRNVTSLLGNHDSYLLGLASCERSKVVDEIISWHRHQVSDQNKNWMQTFPRELKSSETQYFHGGPNDPTDQYIYEVSNGLFDEVDKDIVNIVCGHTHVQKQFHFANKKFINPGSVGQPRDGDPRAAYAIFNESEFHLIRVKYDIFGAMKDAKNKGYQKFCYENLSKGTQLGGRVDKITC
tara:strand:+ start:162 stop:860 length:699 start_codon:yes stop_codon:yes gene_type:complete